MRGFVKKKWISYGHVYCVSQNQGQSKLDSVLLSV